MRFGAMMTGLALSSGLLVTGAQAAVSRDNFPPKTTSDLIALCTAQKDDPLAAAALNYCHGFAEGAVQVALGYSAATTPVRKPFCLPSPAPSHDAAVADFVSWAQADPKRLDQAAMVGLLSYLTEHYPCPHAPAERHLTK